MELARWEFFTFAPALDLEERLQRATEDAETWTTTFEDPHYVVHGTRLEHLPARAQAGLEFNRITYVQDFDVSEKLQGSDALAGGFSINQWADVFGPRTAEYPNARLTQRVGCYLRDDFVTVLACRTCRSEYRLWCLQYLAHRDQHLHAYPALRRQEAEIWRRLLELMEDEFREDLESPPRTGRSSTG
ncbi:MAG: hypothetical protein O3A20_06860 [Planctomycetota bacterium]|nr:hypothetical protein [Planctomycetota bacterium]